MSEIRVIITSTEDKKEVKLNKLPAIFGRSSSTDVLLRDSSVSRKHFRIFKKDKEFFVEDLGSNNGTYIDGKRISISKIKNGTKITAGKSFIKIFIDDEINENLKGETFIERAITSVFELLKYFLLNFEEETTFKEVSNQLLHIVNADRVLVYKKESNRIKLISKISSKSQYDNIPAPDGSVLINYLESREGIIDLSKEKGDAKSSIIIPLTESLDLYGAILIQSFTSPFQKYPVIEFILKGIMDLFNFYLKNRELEKKLKEERLIKENLSRFVPPEAIAAFLEDKEILFRFTNRLEKQTITSFFVDIVAFSTMAEKLSPEETSFIVNEFLKKTTDIVFKNGGSVNKYIGDAVFALFGTPFPSGDEEVRAIRCALEVRDAVSSIINSKTNEGLQVRIGINTGDCMVGFLGLPKKLEYTAIGDSVNIASRLQSIAKPGQILVGEITYQKAKNFYTFNSVGKLKLKGKDVIVNVFEVRI